MLNNIKINLIFTTDLNQPNQNFEKIWRVVATIYTMNGEIKIPVQCGFTDYESKNPTNLWETLLYKQKQLNE